MCPDGVHGLSGSSDKTLRYWDLGTAYCIRTLKGHTDFVKSVAISPDGTMGLSGSADNTLKLWSLNRCGGVRCGGVGWGCTVGWGGWASDSGWWVMSRGLWMMDGGLKSARAHVGYPLGISTVQSLIHSPNPTRGRNPSVPPWRPRRLARHTAASACARWWRTRTW